MGGKIVWRACLLAKGSMHTHLVVLLGSGLADAELLGLCYDQQALRRVLF